MEISLEVINGLSIGFQYFEADEENGSALVVDIFILRLIIEF